MMLRLMRLRTALILSVLAVMAFVAGYWWRGGDAVVLAAPAAAARNSPELPAPVAIVKRDPPPSALPAAPPLRKQAPDACCKKPDASHVVARSAAAAVVAEEDRKMRVPNEPERWLLALEPGGVRLGTASLTGRVVWTGPVPSPPAEHRESDPYCAKFQPPDDRPPLVGLGGVVRDTAVWLLRVGAPPREPPWKSALVAFDKCSLEPRVQVATVGQVLEVVNQDPILHNVHAYLTSETFLAHGLSGRGSELQGTLDKPGVYTIRCDVHPWERATVVVTAGLSPVLTKADGLFEFDNLPAGMYILGAWQETTGISSRRVMLPAGRSAVELHLTGKDLLANR
jgi:hypothetical protein